MQKIFPLTRNHSGYDVYVINIEELRNSPDFEFVKESMLVSLKNFLRFFRILNTGMIKEYLKELIKMKEHTVRIVKALIYHDLYTNAILLSARFCKFRMVFNDLKKVRSIWEGEILLSIKEVENAGFQYLEPDCSGNYSI